MTQEAFVTALRNHAHETSGLYAIDGRFVSCVEDKPNQEALLTIRITSMGDIKAESPIPVSVGSSLLNMKCLGEKPVMAFIQVFD